MGGEHLNSLPAKLFHNVLQLFTGWVPFSEIRQDMAVMAAILHGTRPERPSNDDLPVVELDDSLWSVMQRCWLANPASRPSIFNVLPEDTHFNNDASSSLVGFEVDSQDPLKRPLSTRFYPWHERGLFVIPSHVLASW